MANRRTEKSGDRDQGRRPRPSEGGHAPTTSPWEHVAAGIGALVVLGAAAFLLHQAVTQPQNPLPSIALEVDTVVSQAGGHLVTVIARNDGDATAARLVIEGALRSDSGVVERREVTIDFVPAGSRRAAGLFFANDPAGHQLRLRPVGYDTP